MVECRECNKAFKMITNTHLVKAHGLTPEEYLNRYDGAALYDEGMKEKIRDSRHRVDKPECAHPHCTDEVAQSWNKYCSRKCAMSHRMSKNGRNEQGGSRNCKDAGGWYTLGKSAKKQARERDKYICRKCSKPVKGKEANVHHIVAERCFDTPEEAHSLDNLVTLCPSCHQRVEWDTLRELHMRAQILDEIMKDDPEFVLFTEFKSLLFDNKNKGDYFNEIKS